MDATSIVEFGAIKNAKITILVDNRADLLLQSTDRVKYFNKRLLLAEQGFSLMVEINDEQRIILDTGADTETLQENIKRMEIDLSSVSGVILSHGHSDHAGSMSRILKDIIPPLRPQYRGESLKDAFGSCDECAKTLIYAHPVAFKERWRIYNDGNKYGPLPVPNKTEWESLGANVIQVESPYKISSGCWLTGFIPRVSFETQSASVYRTMYREHDSLIEDIIDDDQAFVINIEDKGLIVVSGCAHAGIINTVNYAKRISGINKIHAIIGGFHLAFSSQEEINKTVSALSEIDFDYLVPLHCTGFLAQAELLKMFPNKFLQGVVGAQFIF